MKRTLQRERQVWLILTFQLKDTPVFLVKLIRTVHAYEENCQQGYSIRRHGATLPSTACSVQETEPVVVSMNDSSRRG